MAASVVCGIDDSTGSRVALRFAGWLAERLDLRLVLLHVSEVRPARDDPLGAYAPLASPAQESQLLAAGHTLLDEVAADEGLERASTRSVVGDPAEQIVSVAQEEDAEMVVVGSRGRGRLAAGLLGSVSSWVAAHAASPVVVVPQTVVSTGDLGAVVCGVDDSEGGRHAVRVAARLADRLRARLVLAHATPRPDVPGVSAVPGAREQLRDREVEKAEALLSELAGGADSSTGVDTRVGFGAAVDVLDEVAEEERAELIVVGSRGRVGIKAAVLGSTSAALAARAQRPVMIVPPAAAEGLHRGQAGAGSAQAGITER